MNHKKNVLSIAGSDSSGGAGIQADIKTFEALDIYSASVITSVTSQNTQGVQNVFDLPDEVIASQLDSVFGDIQFSAVKLGMLKKQSYIDIVAKKLNAHTPLIIVLDPVMISSSGFRLLDDDAIFSMTRKLFPLATLITPNLPEAAALLEKEEVWVQENVKDACQQLINKYSLKAVLLKGGHMIGDICEDTLATVVQNEKPSSTQAQKELQYHYYQYQKLATKNSHGTGCTLASAIAAYLAQGLSIESAVKNAGNFIQNALLHADLQQVGRGTGPLNHHAVFRQKDMS